MPPKLITFDIFGTILDWRTGLETSCRSAGPPLGRGEFDRIIDAQASLEKGEFRPYTAVTEQSLVEVLGLAPAEAAAIAAEIGLWPLYPDADALRALMRIAPCAAMTNSDRCHGEEIQARLRFRLDTWLCAEEARVYKPDPAFWRQMGVQRGVLSGADWWHVSAYADYDLDVANRLGLTTVLVTRPHCRPGPATHCVSDLAGLLDLLSAHNSRPPGI